MYSYRELASKFNGYFAQHMPFPAEPSGLYEPCRQFLADGGKRIRPVLCLMGNELFGDLTTDAWHAASAVELFHNFTLIHDDIMDKAPLRRGKPTVHAANGLTAGILCGDVMNIYAYMEMAKIERGLPAILNIFNRTAAEVCEGQQLDMDFERRDDVTMHEYINMIALKTSVLLACSLQIGALTGGSVGDNANRLYAFGKNMGIAFQLKDDYLDAYGDPEATGKQNGGDIKANKKTFLLIKALENAPDDHKKDIIRLAASEGDGKVADMLDVFNTTGAAKACLDLIAHYTGQAYKNLEDVAIPSARKWPLEELADYLLTRDN
jgi:geranylgeranyl diphosphate synthase, type II